MSASIIPTRPPYLESATARFTATVLLPTHTLPSADRDDVLHSWKRSATRLGRHHRTHVRGHVDLDPRDPVERRDSRHRLVVHLLLHRTGGCGELDHERDLPTLDPEVLDEIEADNVAAQIGVLHDPERLKHCSRFDILCGHRHVLGSSPATLHSVTPGDHRFSPPQRAGRLDQSPSRKQRRTPLSARWRPSPKSASRRQKSERRIPLNERP